VRDGQYLPAICGRAGHMNITAMTSTVAEDIVIARNWKPESVRKTVPGQNTETPFRP